jgi:hypothetical protein
MPQLNVSSISHITGETMMELVVLREILEIVHGKQIEAFQPLAQIVGRLLKNFVGENKGECLDVYVNVKLQCFVVCVL